MSLFSPRALFAYGLSVLLSGLANVAVAEEVLPQLNPASYPSQLFWLLVSFVLLYVIVGRMALPRIAQILHRRVRNIDAVYSATRKFRREVTALSSETQELLNQAHLEGQELLRSKYHSFQADIAKRQESEQHKIAVEIAEHEQKLHDAKNDALARVDTMAAELVEKCVVLAGGSKPTKTALGAALKDETHVLQ